MRLIDLYSDYFANWLSGGNLINQEKISLLGIKPLYDRFVTHRMISKAWYIYSFPVHNNLNITEVIRKEMFKLCPTVKTIVHTYNVPLRMNVNNDVFKRQFHRAEDDYAKYNAVFSQLSQSEQATGHAGYTQDGHKFYITKHQLDRIKDNYDSYNYIYKTATSGGTFVHTYYFIQASAPTKRDMKIYKKELMSLLGSLNVGYKEVVGRIGTYLSNFGPATYIRDDVRRFIPMLMSNENLTEQMPYKTKGLVGGKGLLLGLDAETKLPLMVDFFNSGAAQVIMMLAKSGAGKTFSAFQIALSLIALDIHVSAIDIKGREWRKLLKFVDGIEINMDDENPRFVNTMRLDDFGCTRENSEYYFRMAVRATVNLLSIMVNLKENEGNVTDLETILEQAVLKYFSQNNVDSKNPKTFVNTRRMKYADIIDIVADLATTKSYSAEQRALCAVIRSRCSTFFVTEGRYSKAFMNEITVAEVLRKPLVIYSFNKNADVMLDTMDTLRVFMVQYLDTKKQSIRKEQKLHTAAFYEELQRSNQFGKLVETISHSVTGSRSNNVMIFLLLNAVSVFNNNELNAIKSNITTKIVGKLEDGDIDLLVKEYGCKPIQKQLEKINDKSTNRWQNCFAILYDTGVDVDKAIYRTVVPQYMLEQFKTRDYNENIK